MKKLSFHGLPPPSLAYTYSLRASDATIFCPERFSAKIRNAQQDSEMKPAPAGLYKPNLV
jgi:hypothetical protein